MGYAGSEEFIRLQFEEYLLALLSAVKYRMYTESRNSDPKQAIVEVGRFTGSPVSTIRCFTDTPTEGDPANEFGSEWIKAWMQTENFRIFNKFTGLSTRASV